MPVTVSYCHRKCLSPELYSPGGIVPSGIQQLVVTNPEYFDERVPSCRALLLADGGADTPLASISAPEPRGTLLLAIELIYLQFIDSEATVVLFVIRGRHPAQPLSVAQSTVQILMKTPCHAGSRGTGLHDGWSRSLLLQRPHLLDHSSRVGSCTGCNPTASTPVEQHQRDQRSCSVLRRGLFYSGIWGWWQRE